MTGRSTRGVVATGESPVFMHLALAMAIMLILRPHELFPVIAPVRPVIVTCLISLAVLVYHAPWPLLTSNPVLRLYVLLTGWAFLTAPFAMWRGGTVIILQKMLATVVFLALLAALPRRLGTMRTLVNRFLAAFLVFTIMVLAKGNIGKTGRIMGLTMYDSNELACLCVMAFGLAIGAIRSKGIWYRLVGLGCVSTSLMIVVRSGSRGGGIAAITAMVLTLLLFRGRWRIAALVAGGAFALLALSNPIFRERFATVDDTSQDYNMTTYNGRWALWGRGIRYITENPVMGVGVNNWYEAELRIRSETGARGQLTTAHNMYVLAGAELGLVGLGLFLAIIAAGWRGALVSWRYRSHPAAMPEVAVAGGGLMVGATFLSLTYSEFVYFPMAIGVGVGFEWIQAMRARSSTSPGDTVSAARPGRRALRPSRWRGGAGMLPVPPHIPT